MDARQPESNGSRERVRPAARHDVPVVVDLRVRFLGERARLEGLPGIPPDARARCEALLPVWMGQDDCVLLVGHLEGAVKGYALGRVSTWPPLLKHTHVGEVVEVYVEPAARGKGLGKALIRVLTESLAARGVEVLRAAVAARDVSSTARFQAAGYAPWQHTLVRRADAG
jgi:ribosomal protein S18 acetylase RimI-like enzyme